MDASRVNRLISESFSCVISLRAFVELTTVVLILIAIDDESKIIQVVGP